MSYNNNNNDPTKYFGIYKGKRIIVPNQTFYKYYGIGRGALINTITTTDYAKNEKGEYVTYSIPYRITFFTMQPFNQGETIVVNYIKSVKFESYTAENGTTYNSVKVVCDVLSLDDYTAQQQQIQQPQQQYVPNQTYQQPQQPQQNGKYGDGYNNMVSAGNEPNEYNV